MTNATNIKLKKNEAITIRNPPYRMFVKDPMIKLNKIVAPLYSHEPKLK